MRFMVIMKGDRNTEAGAMPDEQILTAMGNFNEELVKAGVMLAGEGLHPSSKGARVRFGHGKVVVTDGPFAESKELIAGFWIWKVNSKEEALDWLRRSPMAGNTTDQEVEVELRQIFEMEEFGAELTPEARAQEERLRAELEAKK
jgi:hypothetical protein